MRVMNITTPIPTPPPTTLSTTLTNPLINGILDFLLHLYLPFSHPITTLFIILPIFPTTIPYFSLPYSLPRSFFPTITPISGDLIYGLLCFHLNFYIRLISLQRLMNSCGFDQRPLQLFLHFLGICGTFIGYLFSLLVLQRYFF